MIRPKAIQAPDSHFLNAAKGWLELGNHKEAQAELNQISYWVRFNPEVLMIRWKVCARAKDWNRSLDIARSLTKLSPDRPSSWICLSYSLCNTNKNIEAWQQLVDATKKFPGVSAIPYFLARLSCKMGNLKEATKWLNKWNAMVEKDELKQTAKEDPKLEPLWKHLGGGKVEATKSEAPRTRDWTLTSFSLTPAEQKSRSN